MADVLPLFLNSNFVTATSNPMPNANAPAKMVPTNTPKRRATFASTPVEEPPNMGEFLEDPEGPAYFDEPPTAGEGGYPKSAPFSKTSLQKTLAPEYGLHCHSTRNNTVVTFTKPEGGAIAWLSGGSTPSKFRKANRATYEAGYQCAVGIFKKIREVNDQLGPIKLELFFKGFGEGREAMKTAMLAVEGEKIRPLVCRITDRTPIKIGGTRSKKQRRG
ncbi:hypothetical protein GALMADRAFT_274849 [Galerina marginata CBS 339.88]|uniref:Uncharacterized protein n=1 Tax=Galerina marginata (strain CBS 339.88) TaxID=685588 RepID=A0A067TJG9_GALM3|nr:hypothetical protein GALMADRAFT_274849 [Galerina marginata CBS 339.88]